MANKALFITNALQNAKPSAIDMGQQAQQTVSNLLSQKSYAYNAFLNIIDFIANSLVLIMRDIATGALVIASSLFVFEIIIMLVEYFITHEAKKLTQSMIRKLFLFLIVSAFVTHIQQIMSFVFNSFINMGIGVGQTMFSNGGVGNSGLGNPLYSWGILGNIWSASMTDVASLDTSWTNVVKGVPDVFMIYAIMIIISLLIIFIVIQYFIIQLEILIQMSIGSIAITFSMLRYTQDITKNYIKSLINMGIRLFTIITIIFFFNYATMYINLVMNDLSVIGTGTSLIAKAAHPFQALQTVLLAMLFLSLLMAFFVAKAPTLVANAMSGSGSGSGLDAAIVMSAAAEGAFTGANVAVGALAAGAKGANKVADHFKKKEESEDDSQGNSGESGNSGQKINQGDFAQPGAAGGEGAEDNSKAESGSGGHTQGNSGESGSQGQESVSSGFSKAGGEVATGVGNAASTVATGVEKAGSTVADGAGKAASTVAEGVGKTAALL